MPKWSKKDYEMVASVLRSVPILSMEERARLADDFKSHFRADAGNLFDGARFDRAVHEGKLFRPSGRIRVAGKRSWRRQDYEMVASVLRRNTETSDQAKMELAWRFAVVFGEDNPQFRVLQFIHMAGIPITQEQAVSLAEREVGRMGSPQRRPGDIPVVSHLRRRPRKSIVDRFGHRIRVKEWPSSAGMATLRRHMKRQHPIAWRLSVMKGVRKRKARRRAALLAVFYDPRKM